MEFKNIEEIENSIDNAVLSDKQIAVKELNEIIKILPNEISDIIDQGFRVNRIPKEYLFTSILFSFSTVIGLAYELSALGYENHANLFFAIVGNRGDVKSLPMKIATKPLTVIDSEHYKEGNNSDEDNLKKKKLLINNATIQAAQTSHSYNPYSIGFFFDEIMSLVEKMGNKNNSDGMAWRTFLLEGYNNSTVDILRQTSRSFRIDKSYPTLLGSIQEHFLPTLFGDGNLESGFIDRILFTAKLTENNILSKESIPHKVIINYENSLTRVLSSRKVIEEDEKNKSVRLKLTEEAENLLFDYIQNLINQQKKEIDLISAYLSKLQISIHKLIILFHAIINNHGIGTTITIDTVRLAIKVNEFYYLNFKIINAQIDNFKDKDLNISVLIRKAIQNGATQTDFIKVFGTPKSTLSRKWNECLRNLELETKEKTSVT